MANIIWRMALILFCLALISTCFLSLISARFVSDGKGDDSASVAVFHGGECKGEVLDLRLTADQNLKYYAFEAKFSLIFEACEVDRLLNSFEIFLDSDSAEYTSIICPVNDTGTIPILTYNESEDTFVNAKLGDFTNGEGEFEEGYIYCSIYEGDDTSDKNWLSYENVRSVELLSNVNIGRDRVIYNFSVLFFIRAESDTNGEKLNELVNIKYNIDCVQAEV